MQDSELLFLNCTIEQKLMVKSFMTSSLFNSREWSKSVDKIVPRPLLSSLTVTVVNVIAGVWFFFFSILGFFLVVWGFICFVLFLSIWVWCNYLVFSKAQFMLCWKTGIKVLQYVEVCFSGILLPETRDAASGNEAKTLCLFCGDQTSFVKMLLFFQIDTSCFCLN